MSRPGPHSQPTIVATVSGSPPPLRRRSSATPRAPSVSAMAASMNRRVTGKAGMLSTATIASPSSVRRTAEIGAPRRRISVSSSAGQPGAVRSTTSSPSEWKSSTRCREYRWAVASTAPTPAAVTGSSRSPNSARRAAARASIRGWGGGSRSIQLASSCAKVLIMVEACPLPAPASGSVRARRTCQRDAIWLTAGAPLTRVGSRDAAATAVPGEAAARRPRPGHRAVPKPGSGPGARPHLADRGPLREDGAVPQLRRPRRRAGFLRLLLDPGAGRGPARRIRRPGRAGNPDRDRRLQQQRAAAVPRLGPDRGQPQDLLRLLRHHRAAERDAGAYRPGDLLRSALVDLWDAGPLRRLLAVVPTGLPQ